MRIVGYESDNQVYVARRDGDELTPLGDVESFWRDPYAATPTGTAVPVSSVTLVPPVPAGARVLCVGLNYLDHVNEGPFDAPDYPAIFARWTPSLAVADTPVEIPVDEQGLDWEVELLAVVGRPLRYATPEEALDGVYAYGAFNDITARRAQKLTSQWTVGKNADNSGPMSDLVTADEVGSPAGRRVTTRVNGELMQDANTDQLLFGVGDILSFVSRTFTLRPGDLVATGTPNGVGYARNPPRFLHDGDVVEVEVEGIGSVRTPIVAPREGVKSA